MDFFQHQDNARKRTRWLVFYYALAMGGLSIAFYAIIVVLIVMLGGSADSPGTPSFATQLQNHGYFDPAIFLLTVCGVVLLVGGASLLKMSELSRGGGAAVAQQLGGREILRSTRDPQEKRLLNIVEEMSIASGITMPKVYLLDHENRINAFAAGFTPNTAAIGITRGTLDYLNRDELQGVVAHEFSHILNGDMRINLRLICILFGLNLLVIIGWSVLRFASYSGSSSRNNRDNGAGAAVAIGLILGLGTVLIGSLGMLFSSLIQAAISRQREFLADASAVQFTRNPDGIAGALKKIGCPKVSSKIENPNAAEASHMFIANILGTSSFANFLATHPPLSQRIKRIDPSFDGVFPKVLARIDISRDSSGEGAKTKKPGFGVFGPGEKLGEFGKILGPAIGMVSGEGSVQYAQSDIPQRGKSSPQNAPFPSSPSASEKKSPTSKWNPGDSTSDELADQVGLLNLENISIASALIHAIPSSLEQLSREPFGSRAVVVALLLDARTAIREKQFAILTRDLDAPTLQLTRKVAAELENFPLESRIPLVQMSLPALRQLSPEQYKAFRKTIESLVAADGQIDLFEYTLRGLLLNDLDVHFGLIRPDSGRYSSVYTAQKPLITVLSYLSYCGHSDEKEIQYAFQEGIKEFGIRAFPLPRESCKLSEVDAALKKLALFPPQMKKKFLGAFHACILADRKITEKEGELLRAICANLGCPLPLLAKS